MIEIQNITAQSAAGNITAPSIDLGNIRHFSCEVDFSGGAGDLVGALKFQGSNNNSKWIDISGASASVAASANAIFNFTDQNYRYVRLVWSYTSGTGNIEAKYLLKEQFVKGI